MWIRDKQGLAIIKIFVVISKNIIVIQRPEERC